MQCILDHIVLNVDNIEKMITFYSEVLMLDTERLEQYRTGDVSFPSVRINADTVIDLFPKEMWQESSHFKTGYNNLNHFCLTLTKENYLALQKRLETDCVTIEEDPVQRWGAQGVGTSIYFRDPQGNYLEARYYEK